MGKKIQRGEELAHSLHFLSRHLEGRDKPNEPDDLVTDNPGLERWYRQLLALWHVLSDASLSPLETTIVVRQLNELLDDRARRDQWIVDMKAFVQERPEAIYLMLSLPSEGWLAEVRAQFLN